MAENKKLVCIVCPIGCSIEVQMDNNKVSEVSGYSCARGKNYAITECTDPERTITSTVRLLGGKIGVAPVKSDKPVARHLIFECMKQINLCKLQAPVKVGDIVIQNILDTEANIIVTSNIPAI